MRRARRHADGSTTGSSGGRLTMAAFAKSCGLLFFLKHALEHGMTHRGGGLLV
jgi:hypothetical protein